MAEKNTTPTEGIRDMYFVDKSGKTIRPNRKDYYDPMDKKRGRQQDQAIELNRKYDSLVSRYGKDSEEAYSFGKKELGMYNSGRRGIGGTLAVIGLAVGIFFLSPTLTGNAIANLTTKTSSVIGIGLFIVGIIGLYFWFKNK